MKKFTTIIITLLLFLGGGPIACSDVDEYEIVTTNDHVTYMISRRGEIMASENFDTIFVFGHIDNMLVAKEITEYLNQQEPGEPFQYRRFYPDEEIKGP